MTTRLFGETLDPRTLDEILDDLEAHGYREMNRADLAGIVAYLLAVADDLHSLRREVLQAHRRICS